MTDYTKITNFATKDSLLSGNPAKIVKGTEINTEFDNIATAIATKANEASPTFTGTTTIPTVDINGGTVDGVTIGGASAGAGTFTTLADQDGSVRTIPSVGTKTSSYILTTSDVGQYVTVGTGGSITIPNSTFSAGDVITVYNDTTGDITITNTITTAYKAGTDTDQATFTLATRGLVTLLFTSGTVVVASGNI